ncbi:MAG TPA: amino acid deaminase/aldolase [Solirubrobacteraceae bacterium]|nr:amino acid deaminase/aldolase [Solirubrobacteraceae bacterium]
MTEARLERLERLERATAELQAPFAVVDLAAFWRNAADMERRAAGKPIRLASKSVRCRALQERVLACPGFQGTLAFTLPEALWLSEQGFHDVVVAYPTADREALRTLACRTEASSAHAGCMEASSADVRRTEARGAPARRTEVRGAPARRTVARGSHISLMVDSVAQLDLIESAVGPTADPPVEVCIDVDAGLWMLDGRIRIGAKRSPVHTPEQAAMLAQEILARERLRLVGIMAYESQIAGLGDSPPGRRARGAAIRALQRRSARELAVRRAAAVAAVQAVLRSAGAEPLRFVNGGGTGSIELTAAEQAVTEIAAGSGLYGPTLFDAYSAFQPEPAALFALAVVRKPSAGVATVLGGGYLASGPADAARLPVPFLPAGLSLDKQEGAGEVQTPLIGAAARELRVGDRVWFRHAKAGELCERFNRLHLIEGERIVEEVPTYRGEGKCFL